MEYKKGLVSIILVLFLINFVLSASYQQQPTPTPTAKEDKPGWFQSYFGFLTSPIFWGIFAFIVLFFLLIIAVILFIRWLIKFIKLRNDIFYRVRSDRLSLAKTHASYKSNHWFRINKNIPIRLVKLINGVPSISNPIAYHRGDYISHDGNLNISMNIPGDKYFFIFPKRSLLVIPDRDSYKILTKDEKGKQSETEIKNLPRASKIVRFTQNDILLYCEGISAVGLFHFPVLRAENNKIIDLSLSIYQSLKDVSISEYLYQQSDEFVKLNKSAVNINPFIRGHQKVNDASHNVDVPQNNDNNNQQ